MSNLSKMKSLLYKGEMVRAILRGEKTQTRRLVTKLIPKQPAHRGMGYGKITEVQESGTHGYDWTFRARDMSWHDLTTREMLEMSPFQVGDRVIVKETWKYCDWDENGIPFIEYAADGVKRYMGEEFSREYLGRKEIHRLSERLHDIWAELSASENVARDGKAADRKWRPSIFMPHEFSRIQTEITKVRLERLHQITQPDAKAEGVENPLSTGVLTSGDWVGAYKRIWAGINGIDSWAANPVVWVYEFKRIKP